MGHVKPSGPRPEQNAHEKITCWIRFPFRLNTIQGVGRYNLTGPRNKGEARGDFDSANNLK